MHHQYQAASHIITDPEKIISMISKSKEKAKVKVEREIFTKHTGDRPLKWSDIKHLDLQDDDEIHARWEEPFYSENNSYDGHFYSVIIRHELETDEEFQSRIKRIERESKAMRERRYETYLKLKAEFEGEDKKEIPNEQ